MHASTWTERWMDRQAAARVLRLALPFILSNSFWTLQIALDRIFLSRFSEAALAAAMPAAMLFWTPIVFLQYTANYATTFVAQYVGAGQNERVGPVIWQSLYLSSACGLAYLGLIPAAGAIIAWGGHSPPLQALETVYFQRLCFSALPTLITASASSFFAGRGDSWTVLWINVFGMSINAIVAWAWIFGRMGFPSGGIAGAGWATVVGSSAAALLGLALMFRSAYERRYRTRSGWRPQFALLVRLLYFGVPAGLQWGMDTLAFTLFIFLVGRLGEVPLAASNIAFTLNLISFFPALGVGQAVSVLVGQDLGRDRPDLAEQTTWTAFRIAWFYVAVISLLYVGAPGMFVWFFQGDSTSAAQTAIGQLVAILLRFVALYSIFDCMNSVFSSALRGAGDTHFVSAVSLGLAWPIMVVPTWYAVSNQWDIYSAWWFASAYIITVACIFCVRFILGKWKAMRVIDDRRHDSRAALAAASTTAQTSHHEPAADVSTAR